MNFQNKSYTLVTTIVVLACLLFTCEVEEDVTSSQGQLQLKLQSADLASSSGRSTIDMTPKSIIMTLVSNGTETRKTLDLISFSGEFATNPISLSIGNYQITEFLVTNSDDEVIYVVPKKDSEFGKLVSQPLPISITISAEQVQTVAPQVVSVAGKSASQFGYIAFGIDVLPSFKITTMGMVDGVAKLITPRIVLTQASDTLLDYELKDAINTVPYLDNGLDLRVTLMEHGFARYSQVFSADSLSSHFVEPLPIILEEAFTLEMTGYDGLIDLYLETNKTSHFTIDWGNNIDYDTIRGGMLFPENDSMFKTTPYFISIRGDLENITRFGNHYLPVHNIHLNYLVNLKWLTLFGANSPEIDISDNLNLEMIDIDNYNEGFCYFDLSNHTSLERIEIHGKHLKNVNWTGCTSLRFVKMPFCESLEYPFINFDSEQLTLNDSMNIDFSFCQLNKDEVGEFIRMIYENLEAKPSYGGSISFMYNSIPYSTGIYYKELIEEKYGWRITYSEDK